MIAPVQPWRWIRLEIGLAINGAIQYALFIDHPLFWPAVGLSTLLITLLVLWPSSAPAIAAHDGDQSAYWRSVAAHVYALLPLWAGHVALGREQIDEAALQLTARFDHMLRQLDRPSPPSDDSPHPLAAAQNKLTDALEAMQLPAPLQKQLLPQLQQLKQSGQQLALLAKNLPAGEASPAAAAEQIGEQVGLLLRQLESIDADVHDSCRACQMKLDDPAASQNLQATIEEVLTHLQFQDRVNQILSHVQNDIWQLEAMLHESLNSREDALPEPPDTEAWLTALKNSYTTHEQRALHNRDQNDKTPGASDITFF